MLAHWIVTVFQLWLQRKKKASETWVRIHKYSPKLQSLLFLGCSGQLKFLHTGCPVRRCVPDLLPRLLHWGSALCPVHPQSRNELSALEGPPLFSAHALQIPGQGLTLWVSLRNRRRRAKPPVRPPSPGEFFFFSPQDYENRLQGFSPIQPPEISLACSQLLKFTPRCPQP